jgi:hypothetical protein
MITIGLYSHFYDVKDTELHPAFSLENIRCKLTVAQEALERIQREGQYNYSPLPATDINEKPILPAKYEEQLAGATVLLRFTVNCDLISNKTLQFHADVESITVLEKPHTTINQPISLSPSKRRFEVPDIAKRSKVRKQQ